MSAKVGGTGKTDALGIPRLVPHQAYTQSIVMVANTVYRAKRVCRSGCGEEQTCGAFDTKGFPQLDSPEIKYDHRHALKLYMPRNHARLVQTSTDMLQSWRANCDIQILLYNSDPMNPNIADIARVTDYIVAYCCKGNASMKEERWQNRKMAMA